MTSSIHSDRLRPFLAALVGGCLIAPSASAADWLTAPSYYTHNWSTGERVCQYSPIGPYYYFCRPDYIKSGYRHNRSTLDLGNSSDNLHIVEEWGAPVRPYEEWRFPFRPYSVPYGAWGPPYGGLGGGTGGYPYSGGNGANIYGAFFPPYGGGGYGGYGGVGPGGGPFPGPFSAPAVNYAQPWLDGHYPQYNFNDRSQYWRPYTAPTGPPFAPGPGPGPGPSPPPAP